MLEILVISLFFMIMCKLLNNINTLKLLRGCTQIFLS